MQRVVVFTVKRLFAAIIVVWLIITVVFFLAHASPYNPVRLILGQHYTKSTAEHLSALYGLNLPEWQQYFKYLGDLLHGNLGYSLERQTLGQPVWSLLQSGVPVSLKLGLYALILSLIIGLPVGLLSALKQNTIFDHIGQGATMVLFAVPTFVLAPVCQLIFGADLKLLPVTGWGDPGTQGLKEMVLPITIYAAFLTGYFAKSFRSFMLEVLRQDYIRTARAKGLKAYVIVLLHAVKNTLLPLASIVGPTVAFLIVGNFIIEFFFSIPGIGYITVSSVESSDYSVIEATTIILAVLVVVVNALTDIFYAVVDPRVKL